MTHNLHFILDNNIIVASPELNARAKHNRAFERRLETHTYDPSYLLQTRVNDNREFDPVYDLYALRQHFHLTNPEELEPIIQDAQDMVLHTTELVLTDTACDLDTLYSDVLQLATDYIKESNTEPVFKPIEANIYTHLVDVCQNYIQEGQPTHIIAINPRSVFLPGSLLCVTRC